MDLKALPSFTWHLLRILSGLPAPTIMIEKANRNRAYTTIQYATSVVISKMIFTEI